MVSLSLLSLPGLAETLLPLVGGGATVFLMVLVLVIVI